MKPILEYLKKRNTQVYGITDYTGRGIMHALEDRGYKEVTADITFKPIADTLKKSGGKSYAMITYYTSEPTSFYIYNPDIKVNNCLYIKFDGRTDEIINCSVGTMAGSTILWIKYKDKRTPKEIIDDFLNQ